MLFRKMHKKGQPLVLFNVWDAGGAKALEEIGAQAIATGSWSVAAAQGFEDGEKLPFTVALKNLAHITSSVSLPVSFDFEAGYGKSVQELQKNVQSVLDAGAVGINFEDQIMGTQTLYSSEEQCSRIRALRAVSQELFINARTDLFLQERGTLNEAIERARLYAEAGADCFFVPGLIEEKAIASLVESVPLPLNIMIMPGAPHPSRLVELGVSRISYGPTPYLELIEKFKAAGKSALAAVS